MTRKELREKQIADAHEHFANHIATQTAIAENGDKLIVDWRSKSGSSAYYIHYVFDIKYGALYITGDLGSAIVMLTEEASPANLSGYINEVDYFISKVQCSSDLYYYSKRLARQEIKNHLEQYSEIIDEFNINVSKISTEIMKNFTQRDGIRLSIEEHNRILGLLEPIYEHNSDVLVGISSCGQYVCDRVMHWLVGIQMLYEQLSDK